MGEDEDEAFNLRDAEYACQFRCGRAFPTEFLLNIHYTSEECKRRLELKIRKGTMTYEPCGQSWDGVKAYARHETSQHASSRYDNDDPEAQWKCHPCRFAYKTENLLYAHLRNMSDEKTHLTTPANSEPPASLFMTPLGPVKQFVVIWRTSDIHARESFLSRREQEARTIAKNLLEYAGFRTSNSKS